MTRLIFVLVLCICEIVFLIQASAYERAEDIMRFMWMTPIQSFHPFKGGNFRSVLENLQIATTLYFQEFLESNYQIDKDSTLSDSFYFYQQSKFLAYKTCLLEKKKKSCPHFLPQEIINLKPVLIKSMKRYLKKSMIVEGPITDLLQNEKKVDPSLFVWISFHRNGSFHRPHHHKNSVLSGVFYVSVPPTSGNLVFYDPRGALPPFGKTLEIPPETGKLVIFPSYLIHGVNPTLSTTLPRISISFNLDGDWEGMSDVNTAFFTSEEE
jgi:hypothetical protein